MTNKVQFDAAEHAYTFAGKTLPSVTEVLHDALRELEDVPFPLLEAAGQFGQNVHEACDLLDRNRLAREKLDVRLEPYVQAWESFKAESGVVILASEAIVHHEKLGYAGRLDRLVLFPNLKRPCVLDIKTSVQVPRSVGAQTAAYREAYSSSHPPLDRTRYCVHLRPDATYRLERLANQADFALFQSCLNVWRFRHVH